MSQGYTRAAGRGEAGEGSLPTGIDTDLGHQGGSSPTTRPQAPRSRLPNGHEAPQFVRISRPAVGRQDSTVLPVFPAVGAPRRGLRGFQVPSPRSERRGHPAIDVFHMDELIAKGLGLALQIRQHPLAILVFIRLLS